MFRSTQTAESASCAPEPGAESEFTSLASIFAAELERTPPDAVRGLVDDVRRRHGNSIAAIILYGSCLRTNRYDDGVVDLYVLVDSYKAAYDSRLLAYANAVLPPNVFYIEVTDGDAQRREDPSSKAPYRAVPDLAATDRTVRAELVRPGGRRTVRYKYALISLRDFERSCQLAAVQSIIWARFCQPALLAYVRDPAARQVVIRSTVEAAISIVLRAVALLPKACIRPEELWQRGFKETYRAELRVESPEAIQQIYAHAPERYDRLAFEALRELERRRYLHVSVEPGLVRVSMHPRRRRLIRLGWAVRRFLGKPLAAARLLKSMATFGDWVPYALWKLERHTGVRIEPTQWQRRHVWLACWPIIFKLLVRRTVR